MPQTLRIVAFAAFLLVTCVGCSERRSVAPISEDSPAAIPDAAEEHPESDAPLSPNAPSSDAAAVDAAETASPASAAEN